jgi:Spy/CpxP family protein refolding chaperone
VRSRIISLFLIALLLLLPAISSAQPDPGVDFQPPRDRFLKQQGPGPGGPGGHGGPWMGGNRRKHIEQFRMLKLLEFLDLSEDQEIPFLTRYRALNDAHDSLQLQRMTYIEQLAKMVEKKNPPEDRINELITRVRDTEKQKFDIDQDFLNDVRGILTPEQLAKLVVFQDRFEFEMLRQVREFQRQRMQGMMGQPDDSAELE